MKLQATGDKMAIGLSLLCIAHCLLLPVALLLLPTATMLLALKNELVHGGILLSVIPVSLVALYFGYMKHQTKSLVALTLSGLLVLVCAFFTHDLIGDTGEIVLTVVGSILLAQGHLRNYRLSVASVS